MSCNSQSLKKIFCLTETKKKKAHLFVLRAFIIMIEIKDQAIIWPRFLWQQWKNSHQGRNSGLSQRAVRLLIDHFAQSAIFCLSLDLLHLAFRNSQHKQVFRKLWHQNPAEVSGDETPLSSGLPSLLHFECVSLSFEQYTEWILKRDFERKYSLMLKIF